MTQPLPVRNDRGVLHVGQVRATSIAVMRSML